MQDQRPSITVSPNKIGDEKVKSRTFEIAPNYIVAFLKPKHAKQQDFDAFINQAANVIRARYNLNLMVIGLDDWSELRILDEKWLDQAGYVHKDKVFMLKEDVDLTQYTEEEIREVMETYVIPGDTPGDEEE